MSHATTATAPAAQQAAIKAAMPTPPEIRQVMKLIKAGVVPRRNARGGRRAEQRGPP